MRKYFILLLATAVLALSFSGCSPGEKASDAVQGFIAEIGSLFPNDLEYLLGTAAGEDVQLHAHDSILSTGYANMLKSGKYHMEYSLTPFGESIEYGYNGTRAGTSTASEHIVLEGGVCYLLDDEGFTATAVDPSGYPSAPFVIDAADINFADNGEGQLDGEALTYEEYDAGGGTVRFWLSGSDLYALEVSQTNCSIKIYVSEFNKWVSSDLITLPANYVLY